MREKGEVDEHKRICGVVQNPGDLVGVQARVDRVTDGADAGDGEEDLQVPVGAAGKRRHPIAGPTPRVCNTLASCLARSAAVR